MDYKPLGYHDAMLLPILGGLITISQITVALACRYEKNAGVVTPLLSSNILGVFLLEIIVRGRLGRANEWMGAVIVLGSVTGLAIYKE